MKQAHGWAFADGDDFMVSEVHADGTYQASHLRMALEYVTDWTVAVDGGAHVGTWTRLMAARFARVLAFEPSPDTFEALSTNMTAFACSNVEPVHAALGAVSGSVRMELDPANMVRKNLGARYTVDGGKIARRTLDSFNLPTCGFIKLDVEGSEPLALMGARATLARCRPIVLHEDKGLWRRFGMRGDAVERLLKSCGYKVLYRAGCDLIWGPA